MEIDITLDEHTRKYLLELAGEESTWYDLDYNKMGLNPIGSFYQKALPKKLARDILPRMSMIPSDVLLLLTKPGAVIKKHTDTRTYGRKIALTWALTPESSLFAPTIFYTGDETHKHFYTNKCFVFDTGIPHAMINNNNTRILFQIRYITTYDTLVDKIKDTLNELR